MHEQHHHHEYETNKKSTFNTGKDTAINGCKNIE